MGTYLIPSVFLDFFRNQKIGIKILSGYVVALALAAIVGGLALVQLSQVNTTVTYLITPLTQERSLAEKIAAQISRIRLYANQYILQGQNPTDLDTYNQAIATAQTLLNEEDQVISPPQLSLQTQVRTNFDEFAASFAAIVQLLADRQDMVTNQLNPQGTESTDKLATLRNNSFESLDFTSATYASQARDIFSQIEVGVNKYLSTGSPQTPEKPPRSKVAGLGNSGGFRNS